MKKLWKILIPTFVLCVCVLLLPTKASAAATSGTCGKNLTWSLSSGTLTISGYGEMYDYSYYTSPFYKNYNYSSIKTVVIEDGVTSIGKYAFYACSELTSVTIGNGVTSIGQYAFYNCKKLASVNIPISITSIGDYGFYQCSNLTSIIIPDSVTSMGNYVFYECSSLTSAAIGNSVTRIGSDAFYGCSSLSNITIPDSVTEIGSEAFCHCTGLTSATIGNNVTTIGSWAFEDCKNLTSINIPQSVTAIYTSAFRYCDNLTDVYITDIAAWLNIDFEDSYASGANPLDANIKSKNLYLNGEPITNVVIPTDTISIPNYAFYCCNSIQKITISESVTSIGKKAFAGCSNLTGIWVSNSNPNYSSDYYGVLFNKNKTELIQAPGAIAAYVIPDSVTSIDDYAFDNCTNLTNIIIGNGVTEIDSLLFMDCSSLDSITIGSSVNSISSTAFRYCYNLTGIWVNENNPNYSCDYYGVLFNKDNTELIRAPGAIAEYVIPDGVTSIGNYAFYNCYSLTSVTIPDSVTSIGNCTFYGCSNLINASIGNGVTYISSMMFQNCTSLTSVTIGNGVTGIGSQAFYNCSSLEYNTYDNARYLGNEDNPYVVLMEATSTSITSCNIRSEAKVIYDSAFYNCYSLTSITIPDSVTSIGNYAFYNCNSLTDIYITDVTAWFNIKFGNDKSNPFYANYKNKNLYLNEKLLTNLVIPDGVTSIGNYAFLGCSSLTSITIPGSVTSIGNYTFNSCSGLTSVTILDGVTSIGNYAFNNCSGLTNITIPDSVTNIGDSAFRLCQNLSDIYYIGTQQQWDTITVGSNNTYLTSATLHLVHIHSYDTCVITQEPALSASGLLTKTCACGESITEAIPQLVGRVKQWNVALGDDLTVNFYLEVSDSIVSTAKVQLIQENNSQTAKISNLEKTEDGLYKISVHMAAAQMNDTITVMVKNGSDKAPTADYSIRQYCDTLLADESQAAYHGLIKEMLNYGAAAQAFFGYESDGAANEGITGAGQTAVPERAPEVSVSGTTGNVRFYGASLVYESKIAVRFYFTGNVSGCTFTVGEQICTPVVKNGLYYIEVNDVLPQNLDKTIAVTVTSGEDTLTVSYSPLNYIVRMNAKGSETLQNLMRALYNYHLAAKAISAE